MDVRPFRFSVFTATIMLLVWHAGIEKISGQITSEIGIPNAIQRSGYSSIPLYKQFGTYVHVGYKYKRFHSTIRYYHDAFSPIGNGQGVGFSLAYEHSFKKVKWLEPGIGLFGAEHFYRQDDCSFCEYNAFILGPELSIGFPMGTKLQIRSSFIVAKGVEKPISRYGSDALRLVSFYPYVFSLGVRYKFGENQKE